MKNDTRGRRNEMEKVRNIFKIVKSSIVVACCHAFDKHFGTIHSFERAGEAIGEMLSCSVNDAVATVCEYYPTEYRERLNSSIRRGFNIGKGNTNSQGSDGTGAV